MCILRYYVAIGISSLSLQAFGLEPDQLYEKVSPSIVVVVGYKTANPDSSKQGSGVIISPGQVVTNCHVIEGADLIYVKREKLSSVAVIRFQDPERDLCQLSALNKVGFQKAITSVISVSELRVGQKVYAIGAPQGLDLTLSDGLISSLRSIEDIGTVIQTNAPMSPGSSGGGLFDSNGRLIGITSFQSNRGQNLNFAIPAEWILELPSRYVEHEELKHKGKDRRKAEGQRNEEQKSAEREKLRQEEEARRAQEPKRTEEQRRAEEDRQEEERKQRVIAMERERQQQEAARKQREFEEGKRSSGPRVAQQKLIDDWRLRIQTKIRDRIVVPGNISGNPEARFEVLLLPGGEVLKTELKKSSGNRAYDAAVERAIARASPLPVPTESDLFQEGFRELNLVFRPKD